MSYETFPGCHHLPLLPREATPRRKPQELQAEFITSLKDDVFRLLNTFVELGSLKFSSFRKVWDDLDFSLVYTFGFPQLSTPAIVTQVYKYFFEFLHDHHQTGHDEAYCAVIFALYSMYFSQPSEPNQISFPIPIPGDSLRLLGIIYKNTKLEEVAYALYLLFHEDAFQLTLYSNIKDISTIMHAEPSNRYFNTIGIGAGDLAEVASSRNLREQVKRIDQAMQRDPVMIGNYADLVRVSNEYDELVERFATEYLPELLAGPARRHFSQELDRMRLAYSERNSDISSKPVIIDRPTITKGTKRIPQRTLAPSAQRMRRSTVFTSPPRPATAPPFDRAHSFSTIESSHEAPSVSPVDMPDFSFFAETDGFRSHQNGGDNNRSLSSSYFDA